MDDIKSQLIKRQSRSHFAFDQSHHIPHTPCAAQDRTKLLYADRVVLRSGRCVEKGAETGRYRATIQQPNQGYPGRRRAKPTPQIFNDGTHASKRTLWRVLMSALQPP